MRMKHCLTILCDRKYQILLDHLVNSIDKNGNLPLTIDKILISDDIESYRDFKIVKPSFNDFVNSETKRFITAQKKLSLFSFDYDRVVILDADMICLGDLNYLFSNELNDFDICATLDQGYGLKAKYKNVDFKRINSGMMVINDNLLKNKVLDKLLKIVKDNDSYDGSDQGVIHSLIYKNNYNLKILPMEWNCLIRIQQKHKQIWRKIKPKLKILHYVGEIKPNNYKENEKELLDIWRKYGNTNEN
jgi:lipopolysaccharide biosynthesis glycosyltransferase